MGLEKIVRFLGSPDDHIDIINVMDFFVLPSLQEGMPTVLLEAMYLGVPVVASATGGISEIVTDGSNGLLVEPKSESRLAASCMSLIADHSLAKRIGLNARGQIGRYNRPETIPKVLTLYSQLRNGLSKQ